MVFPVFPDPAVALAKMEAVVSGLAPSLPSTDPAAPIVSIPEELHDSALHQNDTQSNTTMPDGSATNVTLHDHINLSLAEDEERVLSGGKHDVLCS